MNYKVPFGTVSITDEAKKMIDGVLDSKWVTSGKLVAQFEKEFAEIFGMKHGVAVSSGTDANTLALAVLYDYGANRGDEVIIPALTFVATANAVLSAGFKPVFVDVQRETLNIDPEKIEAAVTKRTKAIVPVHLMGKPAEMDPIMEIAKKHNLYIVEDSAEAHGAEYKGRLIGSMGAMSAFSLYAAHIVTTIEGGIILTNDSKMAGVLRSLRNHGMEYKFRFQRVGFSAKMNEIEAAVGLGNVRIFRETLQKRRRNMLHLIEQFKQYDESLFSIKEESGEKLGPHAFPVTLREHVKFTRDEFVDFIDKEGVDSRNLFYSIPTQCPGYAFLGHKLGDFPESEYFGEKGLHIGVHQDLELKDLDYAIETIGAFLKKKA